MSYEAGTIVPAANFFVPKATATTLAARIAANIGGAGLANWSWIETIPAGTGAGQSGANNVVVDVFKCAGSGTNANDAGVDFYIGIAGNTSGTNGVASGVIVAENYIDIAGNPANADRGKFKRQCPVAQTGTTPDASSFAFNETYQNFATASKLDITPTMTSGAGGIAYWLKVDHNWMIWSLKIGTAFSTFFGGIFDSLVSGSDTEVMPLCVLTASAGSFARLPGVTSGAGGAAMWQVNAFSWSRITDSSQTYTTLDRWNSGKMIASRVGVAHNTGSQQTYGGVRGILKPEILHLPAISGITPQPGDTVVIDGNTWTVITSTTTLGGASAVGFGNAGSLLVRAT